MKVAKIYCNDSKHYLVLNHLNLGDFIPLREFDIGDIIIIKVEDMTKEEFDNLPEFDGW